MTPERWQQIKQLFQAAIEYDGQQRAAFLETACTDDELRREVEALLAAHDLPSHVLDQPLPQVAAALMEPPQLPALIGKQLGPYKIISEIGRGGMGEVYLARDTRLERPVAIKLLPASFLHDPDRVRRFQQEARAASSLNHPHIVTIHEVAEFEQQRFIVSEFVEGKTLREIMNLEGISVTQALEVAIQTASALSAAHRAGIIHRDIKPENIMVRHDGYVKVLDFGLAKLIERAQPEAQGEPQKTPAANFSNLSTETGVVMGTVNYMSPEQARGQKVDHRSDIFSLGVVLYEMLAGRAPFSGETPSHTIVAILEREPQPLADYLPEAPAQLQRIINHALHKQKAERYQTMDELLSDLQEVRQELQIQARQGRVAVLNTADDSANSVSGKARVTSPEQRSVVTQSQQFVPPETASLERLVTRITRHKLRAGIVTTTALLVLLVFGLWGAVSLYKWLRPASATSRFSFDKMQFTKLTVSGKATSSVLSPDGKYFAYSADEGDGRESLWVQQVNTTSSVALVPPADVRYGSLRFSPDGSYLYYIALEKTGSQVTRLFQIPILGGPPRRLFSDIHRGVTFAPDGKALAFTRFFISQNEYQVIVANLETLEERVLITEEGLLSSLTWSPDGKLLALAKTDVDEEKQQYARIVFLDTRTGKLNPLASFKMRSISELLWLPDQSGLFVTATSSVAGEQIWYVAYPSGTAQRVTNDLNAYRYISLTADSSTLVATQYTEAYNVWVAPSEAPAQARAVTSGLVNYNSVNWFADGRLITAANLTGRQELWQLGTDGSGLQQVSFETGSKYYPVASPDGRAIVFVSGRSGRLNLWRINADGTGLTQLTDVALATDPACSPDGKWVIFSSLDGKNSWSVWRIPLEGGQAERLIEGYARYPLISPDGQFLAYHIEEGQQTVTKVVVRAFAGGAPLKTLVLPSTYSGSLTWTADGKGFTFCDNRSGNSEIYYQPLSGGAPRKLTNFNSQRILSLAWSPDGRQLAFTRGQKTSDVVRISDFK